MKAGAILTAKAIAIWATLLAGAMLGGMAVTLPASPAAGAGEPLGPGPAFLLVNALLAAVLASLGARMTGPLWRRAAGLFVLLYAVETLLSLVESLFFGAFLDLPPAMLGGLAVMNAIKSALAAAAAALLWRGDGPAMPPGGLVWKLPAIVALYVVCYFGAGFAIAWQSEAVRSYYGEGLAIDNQRLLLVQIGRGAIWAGLAWLLAAGLRGSVLSRAVLAGAAFAILMAAPLLYPNGFMPWAVRQVHFVEIGVSNFLFGVLAVLLLSWDRRDRPAG